MTKLLRELSSIVNVVQKKFIAGCTLRPPFAKFNSVQKSLEPIQNRFPNTNWPVEALTNWSQGTHIMGAAIPRRLN